MPGAMRQRVGFHLQIFDYTLSSSSGRDWEPYSSPGALQVPTLGKQLQTLKHFHITGAANCSNFVERPGVLREEFPRLLSLPTSCTTP